MHSHRFDKPKFHFVEHCLDHAELLQNAQSNLLGVQKIWISLLNLGQSRKHNDV